MVSSNFKMDVQAIFGHPSAQIRLIREQAQICRVLRPQKNQLNIARKMFFLRGSTWKQQTSKLALTRRPRMQKLYV